MHKRSIRRAAVSDEDDSDVDMSAQPSHATAIAALKAKRQGIKPKRPVIAADLGEEEDAAPAVLVPKQPAQKPAPAPVQARQEVAKAKAAPVHKPAPRVDGLGGLRLADDYIPLDASRPARAPVGRSRLEAMVYPSSDESGDDTPAVVLDTPDTPSVSNYDTLRAVRDQLANQTERTAPHKLPSMASAGPTLTLHDLIDKYNAMLTEARGVLEEDTRELFRANQTAANASGLISKLESDLLDATQQYDFFSDNRRWVKALCGFLTAKVQDVSGLEAELVAVDTNGSIDTSSRFAADLLDELAEGAARGDERLLIAGACVCLLLMLPIFM